MRAYIRCACVFAFLGLRVLSAKEPLEYVNPYIGTAGGGTEYGGMIPAVLTPFGMTHWTATTHKNQISATPYIYEDATIHGFQGTHQPAIWMGDYGWVVITPETGPVTVNSSQRALSFSHSSETLTPYYYAVTLNAKGGKTIRAEMTAAEHCAIFRFTYATADSAQIFVEGGRDGSSNSVDVLPDSNEIAGYNTERHSAYLGPDLPNFNGHFVVRLQKQFSTYGTSSGDDITRASATTTGGRIGGFARFAVGRGETVVVKVGTSFISRAQARDNLDREIPAWDFDAVRNRTQGIWVTALSKLRVGGGTEDQKAIFYTGLYHAMFYPRCMTEYGRYYSAFDDTIHAGVAYNDYSLWDTFRAENPLLILLAPDQVADMATSLYMMGEQGGKLYGMPGGGYMPMWANPTYTGIMIGQHAHSVIADAYVKGIRGFDLNRAYTVMHRDAMQPTPNDQSVNWGDRMGWCGYPETNAGFTSYMNEGYVDCQYTSECGSRTLEYAYDDFCTAQIALALGKTADYANFMQRSKNYRNIYNGDMMSGDWTEGDEWAYSWCVMQDLPGLVDLMGVSHYNAKLDEHFANGHNNHPNEPCHHYGYLYDYSGQPWKTQFQVRDIADNNYFNRPDGLTGNEDCGQMSSWFIFSSMGFYPVTPGSRYYAIGSPLFDTSTITVGAPYAPATFTIIANDVSDVNRYIQSATLNGQPLAVPFLDHYDIVKGGKLVFQMGPNANQSWGTGGYAFMKSALADTTLATTIRKDLKHNGIRPQLACKRYTIKVFAPEGTNGRLYLCTLEGRAVSSLPVHAGHSAFSLQELSSGIYIARLQVTGNEGVLVTQRILNFSLK